MLPLLKKVATQYNCVASHFGPDHSIITEEKYSFQSDNPIKGRLKVTRTFQVNYILPEPPNERYDDGFIYEEDFEKLAVKFSIDFRSIVDKSF